MKPFSMRVRRARRDATRDAIDARRECTRRCVILYGTSMRVATGISRHDTTAVATRFARVQRENRTKRFLRHPIAFARVASRPSARRPRVDGTTRRVASPRGRAPLCFFSSPPAKIFVRPDVSDGIDGASRSLPRGCPHASRTEHETRVSRYERAIASITTIPRRSATRRRVCDADADATRLESRGCAKACTRPRIRPKSTARRKNLTSDGSRTEYTVGGSPIAAFSSSGSRSTSRWVCSRFTNRHFRF